MNDRQLRQMNIIRRYGQSIQTSPYGIRLLAELERALSELMETKKERNLAAGALREGEAAIGREIANLHRLILADYE